MIRRKIALGLVAASMISTAALAQNGAPGDIQQGMERAVAKAAEGPQALRMFIFNTRGIYDLYYPNVVREVERRKLAAPKAEAKPAVLLAGTGRRD